jgi:hypothetical protein
MRRFTWILALGCLVLIVFVTQAQAQTKEVTEAVTGALYVTTKALPLEEGRVRIHYDAVGIELSDTGNGLFHQATAHVLGGFTVEKGAYSDDRGWGVLNLQNGDKVFYTQAGAGEMKTGEGAQGKVIGTITGGTGKCAGIKGSTIFTRQSVRPAVEGIGQTILKGTITYTLP